MNLLRFVPNFLTLCNLFCGSLAILNVFNQNIVGEFLGKETNWSVWLIFLSAGFDFFDGLSARLLNARTAVGAELDSLADIVSFGVAPAMLVVNMILFSHAYAFTNNVTMGIAIISALLIPLFSAVRLARFNVDTEQSTSFKGLPTPANALFIASLPLLLSSERWKAVSEEFVSAGSIIVLCLVLCVLLVAPVPLISLKIKGKLQPNKHWPQLTLVLISGLSIVLLGPLASLLILVAYLLLSVAAFAFIAEREIPEEPEPEEE